MQALRWELRQLAAATAVLAACGAPGAGSGVSAWDVEFELSIGGADEGPFSFSDIRSLDVADDGTIYVLEAQEQEVRVFGPDGAFLRTIGRRGSGPGEFERANGVALAPGGEVWVYSPARRRLERFDTLGAVRASHHVNATSYGWLWSGGVDSAGRLYDSHPVQLGESRVYHIMRTDPEGGTVDTLPWPDCEAPDPGYFAFPSGSMAIPYAHAQIRVMDPRGQVWCGGSGELTLYQYRLGEVEPTRTLTMALEPAVVSSAERDSAIAAAERFKKQAGEVDLDYSMIPVTKAIVLGIHLDEAARVWVRTMTASGPGLALFAPDGAPLATVTLPVEPMPYGPFLVRDNQLYFTVANADGVPSVVRYRVVSP